jgi:hypothetical protein
MIFLVVLIVGAAILARRRPSLNTSPIYADRPPGECIDRIAVFMAGCGFAIVHRSENSITFTRPKRPDTDLGCFLLLLGLIPGLLYFGLYKGTQTVGVYASSTGGKTALTLTGDDRNARYDLRGWASKNLHSYA